MRMIDLTRMIHREPAQFPRALQIAAHPQRKGQEDATDFGMVIAMCNRQMHVLAGIVSVQSCAQFNLSLIKPRSVQGDHPDRTPTDHRKQAVLCLLRYLGQFCAPVSRTTVVRGDKRMCIKPVQCQEHRLHVAHVFRKRQHLAAQDTYLFRGNAQTAAFDRRNRRQSLKPCDLVRAGRWQIVQPRDCLFQIVIRFQKR